MWVCILRVNEIGYIISRFYGDRGFMGIRDNRYKGYYGKGNEDFEGCGRISK